MNLYGRLELYIGPMYSGKSTELIKQVRLFKVINKRVLILKPHIDTRYDANRIISHNGEKEDSITTDNLLEISDDTLKEYEIIIIDEGQFFKSLKEVCLNWVDNLHKHVIIGGLDGDFQRAPFGEILDLIPHADKYIKLTALCKYCNDGTPGIFSKRIINNQDQILIGGSESYIPVCRHHYNN